jgi:hypothetical protein
MRPSTNKPEQSTTNKNHLQQNQTMNKQALTICNQPKLSETKPEPYSTNQNNQQPSPNNMQPTHTIN